MKKWRIKLIDELGDDELGKFYCTSFYPHVWNKTVVNLFLFRNIWTKNTKKLMKGSKDLDSSLVSSKK